MMKPHLIFTTSSSTTVLELLLLLLILLTIQQSSNHQVYAWNSTSSIAGCQVGDVGALGKQASFDQYSSLLHIFTWMTASCEGIVRSVTFINHSPAPAKHFYLALFKKVTGVYGGGYRVVNYVRIDLQHPQAQGWQTITIPPNEGWKPP